MYIDSSMKKLLEPKLTSFRLKGKSRAVAFAECESSAMKYEVGSLHDKEKSRTCPRRRRIRDLFDRLLHLRCVFNNGFI